MARENHRKLAGIFPMHDEAVRARDDLIALGVPSDEIEIVTPLDHRAVFPVEQARPELRQRGDAALGALAGGIVGCLLGTLLATSAFPGMPTLFGGGGAAATTGALIGIVIGAVIGAVIAWAVAAEQDSFYAHEIRAGRTVLVVRNPHPELHVEETLMRNSALRVFGPSGVGQGEQSSSAARPAVSQGAETNRGVPGPNE
jgi:hypothetical protein